LKSKLINQTDAEIVEKYCKRYENELNEEINNLLNESTNMIIGSNLSGLLQENDNEDEEQKDGNLY
jgi:hypothetical protein